MKSTGSKDHYHGRDLLNLLLKHNIGFVEGNIMKYVFRWKDKGGIEDLIKAQDYLTTLIENQRREAQEKEKNAWMLKNTNNGQLAHQYIPVPENMDLTKPYISPLDYQVNQAKLQEK